MAKSFAENIQTALTNPNVRKFLDMLSRAEGADYNTTFGGGRVESLAKHPNLRAEFTQTDGKKNTSTAAGRYQFMPDTWSRLQKQYPEQMPDFSPQSQDFGAAVLLSQRKALQDVVNGRFGTAVKKVGAEWASLPTSPYPQKKRSWDEINGYLGLQVGGGSGGGGAGQDGISEKQRKQLYTAYRTGAMTDQQKADYERDFEAVKPAGAKLQPVKASPPAAPYELPIDVLMAYKNGSMTPQQTADFERDYRAGKISAPAHVNFSLSATETPIDQRDYTGNRLQEFSDRATQALGNTARGVLGDGIIDAATAVPRTLIGGAEALIAGAGGMIGASGAGLAGIGAGIGSLAQGKGIDESIAQAGQTIANTQAAIQPYLPQPFIAPNTAHSIGESLAIPMFATEGAGQANYDAYGNATSAALTQGLGDAAMAALGFRAVGKPPMARPATPTPQPTPRPQPTPDTPTPTPRPDVTPASDRIILDAENPRTVIPAPDVQPASRAAPTAAEVTTVGAEGLNVLHGSTRADLTADQVQVFNPTATQNRKGRKNGGFYTTPDAAVADKYANMPRRDGAPITPTVYDVQIKAGSRVLQKEGDITRLDEAYINEQRAAGVDVIAGKDPRGQVEYAVINPEAVGNLTPRAKPATPKTKKGQAFTTSNKPIDFEYDVVPIESVVKSTNADLTPNANARPELQPRNRDTDASTAQINEMANRLNPARLGEAATFDTGAPTVVGAEAVAGHGRLAAIQRRYGQGMGDDYRAFVAQKAAELGIDPAKLTGITNPVLVRRLKNDTDAQMVAQDSNAPTTLRMNASEQARIDARVLPDVARLAMDDTGAMNVAASHDFVREFMRSLPVAERGDMMTMDGRVSQTAVRRIQAAVAEKAYKDANLLSRLAESADEGGKLVGNALQKQAGAVAAIREATARGELYPNTLGSDIAQAANKASDIRASGSTVREYLDQGQLVDDGLSAGARELLEVIAENPKSGKVVAEHIQNKIAEIEAEGNPMQDSLFQRNKPQATAIGDRLAEQIRAAGRPADEAVQAGKLAEAYYAATAKALGLTPDEVFAQVGLTAERADVGGANAALRLGEREHQMVFGDTANASSFVHESGHHFLETHAKLSDQSPKIQADVDAVMTWAGHEGRAWSDLTASQKREVHEKFAESFEHYLLTGKAPTAGLKKVFEDFRAWLTDVYTSMTEFAQTNPRASLSPDIVGVMDRMLGGKAEKAANKERGKKRKSEPVEADLLDFKRSAPVAGGVSPDMHQHRYNVLRDIGLTDDQIRGGSVEGDLKRLEWDAELAKYDTAYGIKMKNQLEMERQKLREYGDGVVESMGGTAKATPETRGAAIVRPLEAYQAWYRDKIKAFYKLADEQGAMTGGIELRGLEAKLKENSAFYNDALLSMRKSLKSFMFEQRLLDDRGNPKPMSAKQAEMVRKHLNSIRTFETSRVIGELNSLIDDAVFSTLNRSVYGEARAVNTQYHRIFSDPKGIARLLDVDGINRKISHEKVAANVAALAETDAAQFRHIMKQLESMPTPELQKMGNQAIGEIRAQIAEKITSYDPTKPDTVAAIGKALAPYRGEKLREIFGEKGAQKLETFVAAHGILRRVDAQPSGTSSMTRNVIMKLAEAGTAMVGGGAGLTAGGAYGAAAGTLIGQQIGARIKGSMVAAVDKKSYGKAMSPRQLETMRQTYAATGRRLAALPETEAAAAAARDAPNSTRARTLNARLERTKEWMQFYERLTDDQKAAIKQTGAAVWLSSVSGLGDNQATSNGDNQ